MNYRNIVQTKELDRTRISFIYHLENEILFCAWRIVEKFKIFFHFKHHIYVCCKFCTATNSPRRWGSPGNLYTPKKISQGIGERERERERTQSSAHTDTRSHTNGLESSVRVHNGESRRPAPATHSLKFHFVTQSQSGTHYMNIIYTLYIQKIVKRSSIAFCNKLLFQPARSFGRAMAMAIK